MKEEKIALSNSNLEPSSLTLIMAKYSNDRLVTYSLRQAVRR